MTYALHPREMPDQRVGNQEASLGRTHPGIGVALIVAADIVAVWLLRLIF